MRRLQELRKKKKDEGKKEEKKQKEEQEEESDKEIEEMEKYIYNFEIQSESGEEGTKRVEFFYQQVKNQLIQM